MNDEWVFQRNSGAPISTNEDCVELFGFQIAQLLLVVRFLLFPIVSPWYIFSSEVTNDLFEVASVEHLARRETTHYSVSVPYPIIFL